MTDDGRSRPRVVDDNPAGRRADSRRLRPVEDAPLPERVGGRRRLNVLKPSEAPVSAPTELPPAWLPPKADPTRPPSRRLADSEPPAAVEAPVAVEAVTSPSLLARLEALTGAPRRVLLGAAGGAGAVVALIAIAVGGPDVERSLRFDDEAQRALAAAWRRDGMAGWGGPLAHTDVVASVKRVGADLAPGTGAPVDVVVVAESGAVHGFALPDGTVVLTTGLLWRLGSDAELAAVIAHLHAHQRLGHVAAALDEPADLAERAAAALSQEKPGPDDAAVLVAVAAAAATRDNAHPSELDADAHAAAALVAAGFDATALRTALQRLAPPTAFGKAHPSSPARVAALAALPPGGRVDAERYMTDVVGRLDRRRGTAVAVAPTTAPTTTATPTTPATPPPVPTPAPTTTPSKKKPPKPPRHAPR